MLYQLRQESCLLYRQRIATRGRDHREGSQFYWDGSVPGYSVCGPASEDSVG